MNLILKLLIITLLYIHQLLLVIYLTILVREVKDLRDVVVVRWAEKVGLEPLLNYLRQFYSFKST